MRCVIRLWCVALMSHRQTESLIQTVMALILCKETMIYNAGRRQVNQGGYCLGAIQAKRLKTLNWWLRARIREQEEVNGYGVE